MALPKIGLFFYPGKEYVGGFRVIDIGIPDQVIENEAIDRHVLDFDQALDDLPAVDPGSHKFQRGALLIVAGSRRYTGAAFLASVSALRTGCGIVYLAAPASIRSVIQSAAPEVIFIPLPETDAGTVHPSALEIISDEVTFDAAAVGPGLTTNDETVRFVREFVGRLEVPVLLDADGINAFRDSYDELKACAGGGIIISPHSGELKRLTGVDVATAPLERLASLAELVAGTNVTLVHKGAPTVIAHPTGRTDVNVAGHPGQATAGSGDVLTGAIAGFLAQGIGAAAAARLGVYLHSRAAMIAAEDLGERGMIAGDCMEALPLAIQELEEEIKYG
jgi:NAD(P)H-hydrate epimerase